MLFVTIHVRSASGLFGVSPLILAASSSAKDGRPVSWKTEDAGNLMLSFSLHILVR